MTLTNGVKLRTVRNVPDWNHVKLLPARLDLLCSMNLQVVHEDRERLLLELNSQFSQISDKVFGLDRSFMD